jgi:pSer/pThr/pTyr-binding forkhead associated (FHA) protein
MVQPLDKSDFAAFASGDKQPVDAQPKRPKPSGLIINVDEGWARVQIALRPAITFGRSDEDVTADVDLTSFGARDKGVSRQHIIVMQQGGRLFVKDLGSKNGTRINNDALRANILYELMDGDVLQLGKLQLAIYFVYEPITETVIPQNTASREETNSVRADNKTLVDDTTYEIPPFAAKALQRRMMQDLDE